MPDSEEIKECQKKYHDADTADEKFAAMDELEKAYAKQAEIRIKEQKEEKARNPPKKYNDIGVEVTSMV